MDTNSPNKIALILKKEWLELRQQRIMLLTLVLPPLLFMILPIGIGYIAAHTPVKGVNSGLNNGPDIPAFRGFSGTELGQAIVGQQFSLLLLLLPAIIPSVIASYSIVGEKTSRTLEPLLATPVTTLELLTGKALTALVPAVAITWLVGLIFIIGMRLVAVSDRVFNTILTPGWVIVVLLCSPLLALAVIAATVAVSSRANDPRTAQQISAVVIVPIMLLFGGQLSGILVLSPLVALGAVLVFGLFAAGAMYLAVRVFQREVILTRWS